VTEDCGSLDLSASATAIGGGLGAASFIKNLIAPLVCIHTDETHDPAFTAALLSDLNHLHHGRWTDKTLTVTGRSLGAVTTSMDLTTAARAAGVAIEPSGDGAYGTRIPNVGLSLERPLCLGASTPHPDGPTVTTVDGFVLGQPLSTLKRTYGSRLHLSAGRRSTGGYYSAGEILDAGYYVADNGAYLLFRTEDSTADSPVIGVSTRSHEPPAYSGCGPPN
jgi:hypothetical protein